MVVQELKQTAALIAAGRNFEGNLRALAPRQPALVPQIAELPIDLEWAFGRDGSLTARAAGKWWSGCSLPYRTAQSLLAKMELKGTTICFLAPTHAAQIRVTLGRMSQTQSLIAVVPDLGDLCVMLRCECFEDEIRAGRLWFAWGDQWAQTLEELLAANDGLPVPQQFIRTALVEKDQLDQMIRAAQDVFSRQHASRTAIIRSIFSQASIAHDRICVVTPLAFRLWEDVGHVLSDLAQSAGWKTTDPDDPCQASPVAFARAAAGCAAVVTVNVSRSDLPSDLPVQTKVISWITGPRIGRFDPKGANDALLLADPRWRNTAISAGWPADRIFTAAWPSESRSNRGSGLGIIADTVVISMSEFSLSSQKVLWESIARELLHDPFAPGLDAHAYLTRWLNRLKIAEETVDRALFIDRLILPAYQQGLARALIQAGIEIKLFGQGWSDIEEVQSAGETPAPQFSPRHAGEIRDRQSLRIAAEACAALVNVWPAAWTHPIESIGRPVLKRASKTKEQWLAEAKRLAKREAIAPPGKADAISVDLIRQIIQ